MSNCSQCGSFIPDGQNICSMCMGDINHGSDCYYQQWAEEQMRKEEERQEEYQQMNNQMNQSFTELPIAWKENLINDLIALNPEYDESLIEELFNDNISEEGILFNTTVNSIRESYEKAIAYEQWKAGVFAEWLSHDKRGCIYLSESKNWFCCTDFNAPNLTTTELYNCEEFKEYLEKRREEVGNEQ